MKMLLFWAVVFGISFIVPVNVATGFMLGSIFGMILVLL